MLLYGEKDKTKDFLETIVVCDIKVGRCSQLNEYMKLYEYQRSRSFTDLHPRNIFKLLTISLETARPMEAKFHVEPLWDGVMKVSTNGLCHKTKMAAMSVYGKNL